MWIAMQPLGFSAEASGGNHCMFSGKIGVVFVYQNIMNFSSFKHCGFYNAIGQYGGNIFHAVDGNINLTVSHCGVQRPGENTGDAELV